MAKMLHVTVRTLQKWDRDGRFPARRTHTNRRYYTDEDVAKALGLSISLREAENRALLSGFDQGTEARS